MKPKHANGRVDQRYSVTREHTGRSRPQWVARFCGVWIGSAAIERDAWQLATDHAAARTRRLPESVLNLARSRGAAFA